MESTVSYQNARIITVDKDSYRIVLNGMDIYAEIEGKLRFAASSPLDLPTVGDWVRVKLCNEGDFALIHEILPRKTLLKRKAAGKNVEFQLLSANIDGAFIIQSLDHNFNLRRLERYLSLILDSSIQPIVLLSKADLLGPDEINLRTDPIRQLYPDLTLIPFSNPTGEGVDQIRQLLLPDQTYCLLGSSGVGKTTLLNTLLGQNQFATAETRQHDSHGRHTTTRRQLISLPSGAFLIDTPGMRELAGIDLDSGLELTFDDIAGLALQCRFTNCTHTREPGCVIQKAIEQGDLSPERLENYLKMQKETRFNEMSYSQKHARDKSFGKMVKNILKHHHKYDV